MSLHAPYVYRLSQELHKQLQGMTLEHLYSLDKKQLFFTFKNDLEKSFHLVFRVDNPGCYFSFPETLSTAVSNRLDRFTGLTRQTIHAVTGHPGERSFHLEFGDQDKLIFQCYGRNAQVIALFEGTMETFRDTGKTDMAAEEEKLDTATKGNWPLPSRGEKTGYMDPLLQKEFQAFTGNAEEWLQKYLYGPVYLNKDENGDFFLSPFEGPFNLHKSDLFIDALDQWTRLTLARAGFVSKKTELLRQFTSEKKNLGQRLKAITAERKKLDDSKNYRHLGDLILANLHRIPAGAASFLADDYLTGGKMEIKLQTGLNPQENAQRYYRKAKNQYKESEKLDKLEVELDEKLGLVNESIVALEAAESLKELRPLMKEEKEKAKERGRLPYHRFEYMGYSILVGKQATDNDTLTLKVAKKDDLWLHARDVGGSHVIIRKKAGESFPDQLIDHACGLALWFSKRRTETLAPVIVTEKKYVRKRKGDPAGTVVVDRETVRMAVPVKPDSPGNGA